MCVKQIWYLPRHIVRFDESHKQKQKKAGPVLPFNLYLSDKFESVSERIGTRKPQAVLAAVGKDWKALSEEEKEVYRERLREIQKEQASAASEATSGNDKQTDNDEKAQSE